MINTFEYRFCIHCFVCITTADIRSHLPVLIVVLKSTACQWFELGLQLGLDYFKLKEIKKNNSELQEMMLAAWLDGGGGECTKQNLREALLKI